MAILFGYLCVSVSRVVYLTTVVPVALKPVLHSHSLPSSDTLVVHPPPPTHTHTRTHTHTYIDTPPPPPATTTTTTTYIHRR